MRLLMAAWLCCVGFLLQAGPATAKDAVTQTPAQPGEPASKERSENQPHPLRSAGLVVGFADADSGAFGDSLAYLYRAELATALGSVPENYDFALHASDSARDTPHPLMGEYHIAAANLATQYDAPLTFWGVIRKNQSNIAISSYISLRPDLREEDFSIRVDGDGHPTAFIQAGVTRRRFGFESVAQPSDHLFKRQVVTNTKTTLSAQPHEGAEAVALLEPNTALDGLMLQGPWYQVRTAGGRDGFVHIERLKIVPASVFARRADLLGRDGAGIQFPSHKLTLSTGSIPVSEARLGERGIMWYRVRSEYGSAWLDDTQVAPQFSLPALHFLAGLYYLRAPKDVHPCPARLAAEQFAQFIYVARDSEKNTNLAAAHQFVAISEMHSDQSCGRNAAVALAALTAAVNLTPFDAAAYHMRAVAGLAARQPNEPVVADLHAALDLDVQDPGIRSTVTALATAPVASTQSGSTELTAEVERLYRIIQREFVAGNIARIRHARHLQMESKGRQTVPAPAAGVRLTFRNRTGTPLDLYLLRSENETKFSEGFHVRLSAGEQKEMKLPEGTYEIAAEGRDDGIKAMYGEHTYGAPSHFELDFRIALSDEPLSKR